MPSSRAFIIAGPNGAGKTTFARMFLPSEVGVFTFINADLIAAGLSPFRPDAAAFRAGRLMLEQIDAAVAARDSFGFETTLSGRGYANAIPRWRGLGYHVSLIFLQLDSVGIAIERVRGRVAQGGHDVPENVIRRRFVLGRQRFEALYRGLVDEWAVYNASSRTPTLIAEGSNR